ncbi:acyl carrier protein [Spirochaetia bacterium]|nr:acyl carrier protein [Spirochaetia bacterium]
MNLQEFVGKFAECFDDVATSEFKAGTVFKELDTWTSLMALSIIAMVDDEYGVYIKASDIKNSETIEDLFNTVKRHQT